MKRTDNGLFFALNKHQVQANVLITKIINYMEQYWEEYKQFFLFNVLSQNNIGTESGRFHL